MKFNQIYKGIVDERHPIYLETPALSSNTFLYEAIEEADLIINIRHDTIEKPPFIMNIADKIKVIHMNFFAAVKCHWRYC